MSAKVHNFRIGLFVLAGAALFVGALFAVGLKAYFGKRDVFETYVTGKVENLSVGALVKLRGVTIGKVSSIDFVGTELPNSGATPFTSNVFMPSVIYLAVIVALLLRPAGLFARRGQRAVERV